MGIKKILASLFISFHVLVIFLFPNSLSYFNSSYHHLYYPYANLVGVNSTWSFYAPDPETARHLEYEIEFHDDREPLTLQWPSPREKYFDFTYWRLHSNMYFYSMNRDWINQIFIPWVCRSTQGAARITVKHIMIRVPSLTEVQDGAPLYDPDYRLVDNIGYNSCEKANH